MPIPTPNKSEDKNAFVSRCVSFLKNEDPNMPNNQAVAVCQTEWKDKKKDQNLNFNVAIAESTAFKQGNSEVFVIKGIAINSTTTRNGHTFLAEELEMSASGLIGKPILKDHTNTVDSVVGKVVDAFYDRTSEAIRFEAKIIDRDMQEKIRAGLIDKVSVGAHVSEIEDGEGDTIVLKGIEFVELSLVAVPADPGAGFAMAVMQSLNNAAEQIKKEKMSEEKKVQEKVEETKTETVKEDSKVEKMLETLIEQNRTLSEKVVQLEESANKKVEDEVEEKEEKVEEKVDETKGVIAKESNDDEDKVEEEYNNFVFERSGRGVSFYQNSFGDSKILNRGNN